MWCFVALELRHTLWREHFDIILPAHVFIVVIDCTILFYIFLKKENFPCAPVARVHIVQKFEVTNCCVFTFMWSSIAHIRCMLFFYCMWWHGWQCVIVYLPCCHHCELNISFQHWCRCCRPAATRRAYLLKWPQSFCFCQICRCLRTCTREQMRSCLVMSLQTMIIFYILFCLLHRGPHGSITCSGGGIVLNFQLKQTA